MSSMKNLLVEIRESTLEHVTLTLYCRSLPQGAGVRLGWTKGPIGEILSVKPRLENGCHVVNARFKRKAVLAYIDKGERP